MEMNLGKIIALGIYNSKVAVKNKNITKNRKTTMFEIEMPIECGGISYIDSESMEIGKNMLICAKPGQIRHTKLPFKCYYIHIMLDSGILYDALMNMPNFIRIEKARDYLGIFEKLCKYYDTALEDDEMIIYSLILKLIYKLRKEASATLSLPGAKSSNKKAIDDAIKYINDNVTSDLSLEKISAYLGFSPIYFHNLFKTATGKTLRNYVESVRIKKAANMIISSSSTLTEIAYECGFSSQSYFSYAFKRTMNLTPREYEKRIFKRYEADIDYQK